MNIETRVPDRVTTERIDVGGRLFVLPRRWLRAQPRTTILVLAIAAFVGVFFAVTLRHGQNWGDDFAMYISHARNIATGHAYADTGYIYNPANPGVGPRAYPPMFPLLLSPVYMVFGFHLTPMKLEIVAFFVAALVATYFLFRDELRPWQSIALVALLGLNPYFWEIKDQILSDVPFLFFVLIALILIRRHVDRASPSNVLRTSIGIGLVCWAAYATRAIGLILLPVLVLSELAAFKRVTRIAAAATGVFAILAGVQWLIFGGGQGSYLEQVSLSERTIWFNIRTLPRYLQPLWGSTPLGRVTTLVFILVGLFAAVGLVARARTRLTPIEIFPVAYALALMVWPQVFGGTRFWIPVMPFYVFFALVGFEVAMSFLGSRRRLLAAALLAVFLTTSYVGRYAAEDYGPIAVGVERPATVRFFRFIRGHTEAHAVILFKRPRALALYTGRRSFMYQADLSPEATWRYLEAIHAGYIAVGPEDGRYLTTVVALHPTDLIEIYRDAQFRIFQIIGRPPFGSATH